MLGHVSGEVEQSDFTLTIEVVPDGDESMEIVVPDETSEPISEEAGRVVWAFDDIENLERVTFGEREQAEEQPDESQPINMRTLIPVAGAAVVVVAAAAFMLMRKK
jgi:hypothetical protein